MKYYLIGIYILANSNICFSVTKDDLKGATIEAESSIVNLQNGTVRYIKPVVTTKDGKTYKAEYLEESWEKNTLIEIVSHGSPITYVDNEAKGGEVQEGTAKSLSYKSEDKTAFLEDYCLKDAEGNILKSKKGSFILEK